MHNIIGAIVIAAAVAGAMLYNGHQDRLQRQCLAAINAKGNSTYRATKYDLPALTGRYCEAWRRWSGNTQ